ncbi:MAG: ald [Proteobacteria bacterium]|nr:ald [Pseudomonadota bacterium]
MKIGLPKEIKDMENRVALAPAGVARLCAAGHRVVVQEGAGAGSGFGDRDYLSAGAVMVSSAGDAWDADLVVKVKEPEASEYKFLRRQMVFTFYHLAGAPPALTQTLLANGSTAIAYETLQDARGLLPLLAPMSAIAGNMACSIGAYYLARTQGGKGVQLGDVLGVRHGRVLIVGDGVVGIHAAKTAYGIGATVTVAGLSPEKAERMRQTISPDLGFFLSEPNAIADELRRTDLLIGAVLRPGAKAEFVVTSDMVKNMEPGSVIVDVSIDQGGCIETSHPTTHSNPVYRLHDVVHYCVANMPAAYPRSSTLALTEATLPYVLKLADRGLDALREDPGFAKALNVYAGHITCRAVADDLAMRDLYRDFMAM